jgi:ribosome-associated protein
MEGRRPRTHEEDPVSARPRASAGLPGLEILHAAARTAVAKKALRPVALDLRDLDGVCDYFLIVSATSEVQVKAVAEAIEEKLKALGARPWHVEGREGRRWVLLDYVETVVHVFHEKTREYYMLDRLWGDARSVDLCLDDAD